MNREQIIINILANSKKPLSSREIADVVSVSIRTVKYDMDKVANQIANSGGVLRSKRGIGYWIEVVDNYEFSQYLYQLEIKGSYFKNQVIEINPDYFSIMQHLIVQQTYFKVEDITEKFYISRNTAQEVITLFREILDSTNLKLKSKPNFGLKVVGNELSRRLAMIMLFQFHFHKFNYQPTIQSFFKYFEDSQKEIIDIRKIFLSIIRERGYSVTDNITQALSRYLILQRKRSNAGLEISFKQETMEMISRFDRAYSISDEIFQQISEYYNQEFDESEICAFTLLLISARDVSNSESIEREYAPIWKYINSILKEFNNTFFNHKFVESGTRDILSPEIARCLVPAIVQSYFKFNLIGLSSHKYIYSKKIETYADFMSDIFSEMMINRTGAKLPSNVHRKISQDFAIMLKKFNSVDKMVSLNILVASNNGIRSAENIKYSLKNFLSTNVVKEIRCIELYEGRTIPNSSFDLVIIEDINQTFYDYSWPVIEVKSENIDGDLIKVINRIYKLTQQDPGKDSLIFPFVEEI